MNKEYIERSCKYTICDASTGFKINFAGMKFTQSDLDVMATAFQRAASGIAAIEAGEVKNPDEKRKVTHFTDRINYTSSALYRDVEEFAAAVNHREIVGGTGKPFDAVIVNGIGGSALGPQLMQFALNGPYWNEKTAVARRGFLRIYFLDNTDSSGFKDALEVTDPETTLHLVISKSGGTRETANNMVAMERFYVSRGLDFAKYAVAVTMKGSKLDVHAKSNKWLKVFEMAESIGGRTSETSIVGHVPAALTGVDFKNFLNGACSMDCLTRGGDVMKNPAMMLAAMWYIAGNGRGNRNMVIVPYCDRLVLLSRYLQQLVMESLGKELDLDGNVVHQGLSVFGNKGGTDAHAFIQQLNDGRDDFFATFIEIMKDAEIIKLDESLAMGDYLHGFLIGLSSALLAKGRQVISIKLPELNAFSLGQIIALYERAVAIYAEYININAFHQPGVQAYKLAANGVLELREKVWQILKSGCFSVDEICGKLNDDSVRIEVQGWLDKAVANGLVKIAQQNGKNYYCF